MDTGRHGCRFVFFLESGRLPDRLCHGSFGFRFYGIGNAAHNAPDTGCGGPAGTCSRLFAGRQSHRFREKSPPRRRDAVQPSLHRVEIFVAKFFAKNGCSPKTVLGSPAGAVRHWKTDWALRFLNSYLGRWKIPVAKCMEALESRRVEGRWPGKIQVGSMEKAPRPSIEGLREAVRSVGIQLKSTAAIMIFSSRPPGVFPPALRPARSTRRT